MAIALRIASRGSQLALWQANHVADLLRQNGHQVSIEVIKTTGDKILDVALAKVGTKGMFTKEIEEALAAARADIAVHSLKDVPTELDPAFELGAILKREDARDAFVSLKFASIAALPQGARVGTSSLRRQAQIKALRPDVEIVTLRGNVDTRLRKLEVGEYDAIILAHAGLKRLGKTENIRAVLSPELMCPAAGQGAVAIEIRVGDEAAHAAVGAIGDALARAMTTCERACLLALGGGCQVPIGAYAVVAGDKLSLTAVVARPDGRDVIRRVANGPLDAPEQLGNEVAQGLLERGARRILADIYNTDAAVPQQP